MLIIVILLLVAVIALSFVVYSLKIEVKRIVERADAALDVIEKNEQALEQRILELESR